MTGDAPGPQDRAWAALSGALGLSDAAVGEWTAVTASDAPALAGEVELMIDGRHSCGLTLRTDKPAPGIALVFVYTWLDQVHTHLRAYLFGDQAAEAAAHDRPLWRAWMDERFPPAEAASTTTATS